MKETNITGVEIMDEHTERSGKLLLRRVTHQPRRIIKELKNDHLFPEATLKKLRDLNREYGVLYTTEKYKMIGEHAMPIYDYKIIRLTVGRQKGETETCFIEENTLRDFFSQYLVLERGKRGILRVPLFEAWLKWTGKRTFGLCDYDMQN